MAKPFPPQQPGEVLVFPPEGLRMLGRINTMLKPHGLVFKHRGSMQELGDQVYLRLEKQDLAPAISTGRKQRA